MNKILEKLTEDAMRLLRADVEAKVLFDNPQLQIGLSTTMVGREWIVQVVASEKSDNANVFCDDPSVPAPVVVASMKRNPKTGDYELVVNHDRILELNRNEGPTADQEHKPG